MCNELTNELNSTNNTLHPIHSTYSTHLQIIIIKEKLFKVIPLLLQKKI